MKGQTIIEVLVALGVVVIVVTAITITVITALSNTQYSKNENLASQYAQQGLEFVRGIRDNSYTSFASLSGTYCLAKDAISLPAPTSGCSVPNIDSTFVRSIIIEQKSPDCVPPSSSLAPSDYLTKVTSSVSWSDGKCTSATDVYCHQAIVVSCLGNQNVTAP